VTSAGPAIQLIANLVVRRADGRVLFVRYDAEDERWWLPGGDLEPYEHPDERVRKVVADLPGLRLARSRMTHVESFRGRRGWHVVFHYLVDAEGDVAGGPPAAWHVADALPRTAHGPWETDAVARALAEGRG
jgi:ADP-ribose pyrophosphatase YjhB (NUDIX family)